MESVLIRNPQSFSFFPIATDKAVTITNQKKNHGFLVLGNSSAQSGSLIQAGQDLVGKSKDDRREYDMTLITRNPPCVPDLHRLRPQQAFQSHPTCHLDPACPSPSCHLPSIRVGLNFYHTVASNVKTLFRSALHDFLSSLWQAAGLLLSMDKNLSTPYSNLFYSILLTVPSAEFPTTTRLVRLTKRPFSTTPGMLFKVDSRASGSSIDRKRTSTTKLP